MATKKRIVRALWLVSVSYFFPSGAKIFAVEGEILITLVRHADIALPARVRDPDLLPEGSQRAEILGEIVREKHIEAVFTTEYLRTKKTAEIVATKTGAVTRVVGAARQGDLVAEIKENFMGKAVLVVGHSNTVPNIIEALGGPSLPDINEGEFDNIFEVRIVGDKVELSQGKYGARSEPIAH